MSSGYGGDNLEPVRAQQNIISKQLPPWKIFRTARILIWYRSTWSKVYIEGGRESLYRNRSGCHLRPK